MSRRNDWRGHNCMACNKEGRAKIKLAAMTCEHRLGGKRGKVCGAFVCSEHGHKEGKGSYCNECRPLLFDITPVELLTPVEA